MAESSIRMKNSGTSSAPIVVANYAALPAPNTVPGQFYWCSASQGWLVLGTKKNSGMYYSNGTTWEFIDSVTYAIQAEVDAGTETEKYVSPKTLLERLIKYLQFNTTDPQTQAVGKVIWNDTDGTLEFGLKGGNVNLQIGQETVVRVVNKTGSLISNGKVVRVVSVTGGVTGIALAQADSDANSSTVIGITTEDIANNAQGFVTIQGLVHGLNTNSFTEGDVLYLSPTSAGDLTNVKPVAPQHMVIVGYVAKKNVSDGHVLLHVQNGYELEELHNVLTTTPANNEALIYESSTQLWKNKSILTALGWFTYNRVAESTAVTGTTTETIIENIKINANTFASGGILRSYNNKFRKVNGGTPGSLTIRFYISPNNNSLTGATQIAIASIPSTNLFAEMLRTFTATTTSLIGWNSTTSSTTDVTISTSARTETAVTWSNDQYFIITGQLANASDIVSLIGASLKNF